MGVHFNSVRNGVSFAFYGDLLEDMGPMVSLKPDVINYFINNEIFSVEAFDSHFPHSSDFARDAETIFVKFGNEILRSSIPPNYNEKTLDHARGGKYEYSFSDLVKREKIRTNIPMFYTGITNFESAEIAPPLSTYDAHEQYVAIFGTNSAMFAWASYFFGVASETYDPLAVGIVVRRIGTLFKPGVTAGSRFLRLANAVQKIKTKPGLTLEQIAQLDDFLLNIPQGKFKNLSSAINNGETTFVRPRGDNPNQVGYYSVRQNGDQGEFVEIAYIQKEGNTYYLRIDQSHFNTPGFEDVPVGQGTHFDVGGGVQIRNNQGQYLKDVQLVRREDGLTSFTGQIDIVRTRLAATNASEELIQRVSQSEFADELSLDLVIGGSGFIATFNQSVEGLVGAWGALSQKTIRTDVTWLNRVSDWLGHGLRSTKEGDLVHLLDVNDRIVGTIRNETLLVTNHPANWGINGFSGSSIGEVVNGCQLYRDGSMSFFIRVPDLSGFTEVERGYLTASPKAHCPEKQGSGVTDEALKFRTETGIAPNGEYGDPVNGTRFYSNTEIKACMIELGPGTPAFEANLNSAGDRSIILNYDMGMSLGEGYRIGGNSLEGDIQLVTAIWWKDGATQQWFLRTMYPVLQLQ